MEWNDLVCSEEKIFLRIEYNVIIPSFVVRFYRIAGGIYYKNNAQRHTHTHTHTHTYIYIYIYNYSNIADRQTDMHTDLPAAGQTDRQSMRYCSHQLDDWKRIIKFDAR